MGLKCLYAYCNSNCIIFFKNQELQPKEVIDGNSCSSWSGTKKGECESKEGVGAFSINKICFWPLYSISGLTTPFLSLNDSSHLQKSHCQQPEIFCNLVSPTVCHNQKEGKVIWHFLKTLLVNSIFSLAYRERLKTGGLLIIHFSDIQTEKKGASETKVYLQGNTL